MRYKGRHLGRGIDEQERLKRALIQSLIKHGKITTTLARVDFLKQEVDKLVTLAKKGTTSAANRLKSIVVDTRLTRQFIDFVISSFAHRSSGFTRRILLQSRRGDGAPVARLEWVTPMVVNNKKLTRKRSRKKKKDNKTTRKND